MSSNPSPQLLARRLAELERCQSSGGRSELGAFSIEGTRLLERALRAKASLRAVVLGESFASRREDRVRALIRDLEAQAELEIHRAPDASLADLLGGRSFGDVLALVERPAPPKLADCLTCTDPALRPTLLCVVDGSDPGNVGALVRTALASGARALVAVGVTDPYHPKALRTSMGSLFRLPVLHYESVDDLLGELRSAACRSLGAVASGGPSPAQCANSTEPIALFLGSEAFGLSPEVCAQLDGQITIPMVPGVDSLSINAAAAVCLYELISRVDLSS